MEANKDDLKHIRLMMERSTKFLSLSGFSGIGAGLVAILGALCAKLILNDKLSIFGNYLFDLTFIASIVIILAASVGYYFSLRKAKKMNSKFWMPVTRQIVADFAIPMVAGGIFSILLIYNHATHMVASAMLIFYGLALINASSRTYKDIRVLGFSEIILGFLAGIFIYNGLLFWTIGFGLLHIVYGIVMYYKYDKSGADKTA